MTHFTIIWIGQAISAAVYAVASLLPGSAILGNLFFDTSIQATPAIYVNAQQVLQPTAGGLQFPTNGTQSGVVLKDATQTQIEAFTIPCTNSGGNANYDTCTMKNPLGKSGALVNLSFGCSAPEKTFVMSGSFVKGLRTSATAASLNSFGRRTFGTGTFVQTNFPGGTSTGAIVWNRDDYIKFQVATTAVDATYNLASCRARAVLYDPNLR